MGLAKKIAELNRDRRHTYASSLNLSRSETARTVAAQERSDAAQETERIQHIERMRQIAADRGEDPHKTETEIRRRFMESDLRHCGYASHVTTCKHGTITFLTDPQLGPSIGERLGRILEANPNTDLLVYEDDLEVLITRIDRPEPKEPESGIIIGGM